MDGRAACTGPGGDRAGCKRRTSTQPARCIGALGVHAGAAVRARGTKVTPVWYVKFGIDGVLSARGRGNTTKAARNEAEKAAQRAPLPIVCLGRTRTTIPVCSSSGTRTCARTSKTTTFELSGTPAAPHGVSSVEVAFDMDTNSSTDVSASGKTSCQSNCIARDVVAELAAALCRIRAPDSQLILVPLRLRYL